MRPLADQPTREMLYECTSVWVSIFVEWLTSNHCLIPQFLQFQVEPGDNYPQQMCAKCWMICKTWSDFKALAKDSDRQLRFENQDENVDEEEKEEDIVTVKDEELESLEEYSLASEEEEKAWTDPLDRKQSNQGNKEQSTSKPKGSSNVLDKPFECEDCKARFVSMSALKYHKRYHSEQRSYQCEECDKKFHTGSNLKRHKLIHTGIKPFECDECDSKFTLRCNLVSHQQSHSKIPFKCHLCGKTLKSKRTISAHMKRVHP